MVYDRGFNNPLAIWTAFRGEMLTNLPVLKWVKRYGRDFGYTTDYNSIAIHANGNSYVVRATGNSLSYISYYDTVQRKWVNTNQGRSYTWYYEGNGIYLGVSGASVYYSRDGRTWLYAGYCPGMLNPITCGASNGVGGVVCPWYVDNPLYYRTSFSPAGAWTLAGKYDTGLMVFNSMSCHKGMYVGFEHGSLYADREHWRGIMTSATGASWRRTLQLPHGASFEYAAAEFGAFKSVGAKLFVETYVRKESRGSAIYGIGLMNDSATSYVDIQQEVLPYGTYTRTKPYLSSLIYVPSLGKFLMFCANTVLSSPNGRTWTEHPQTGFPNNKSGAVYVPGDGLYVGDNADRNYIWYAPCP